MTKVELARKAIEQGRTMGQFLRELPKSRSMSKEELSEYGHAYVEARGGSFEISSTDLLELGWPDFNETVRKNIRASWALTGKPEPEWMR